MVYDRYDNRGSDQRRGWRENDRYERGSSGGREGDDRGFFERARDEVSSWFGDEDSGQRRMQDDRSSGRDNMNWSRGGGRFEREDERRYGSSAQDRGMFGSGDEPWGRGREEQRPARSQSRGGMFSHDEDRFSERGRFGQGGGFERGYQGSPGRSSHLDRDRDYGSQGSRYGRDDDYRPMTGDYGRGSQQGYRSGMGGQDFSRSQYGRQDFSQDQDRDRESGRTYNYGGWGDRDSQRQTSRGTGSDDHYSQWRQRQIQELDRDYDDYRREHQSKFENEFSGWRTQRQTKRQMLGSIREHMEVVDESGEHIGTVDCVRGDNVILTKSDPSAGGVHRSFGCSLVERVDDKVHLSGSESTIRSQLHEHREDDRNENRGVFGGGRSDEDRRERREERLSSTNRPEGEGPHMLDRSFSGTYDDKK